MPALPPPPPASLAGLPGDIQRLILERIPCSADHSRMALVCHAWRDLIVDYRNMLGPPAPLPLLLLPAELFDDRGVRAACVLCGGRVHHSLDIVPPNARCFGSHDGAWLFLGTLQPRAHLALNIRSGDTRAIPSDLLRWTDPQRYVHGMVIHAAALSTSPDEASCVGAAIVTSWQLPDLGAVAALPQRRRCVALWSQDALMAFDYVMPPGDGVDNSLDVEDVIFLRDEGELAFLTSGEHLRICRAILHGNDGLETQWLTTLFRPSDRLYEPCVRARYLVASSGILLMVVRLTPSRNGATSHFMVFQETQRDQETDDDPEFPVADYPFEWTKLETLDGRMLFVGHGCSRSYRADEYPGFKEGVYFLDDGEYFDDAVIFANLKRYPCTDNGKWSEGHVELLP